MQAAFFALFSEVRIRDAMSFFQQRIYSNMEIFIL